MRKYILLIITPVLLIIVFCLVRLNAVSQEVEQFQSDHPINTDYEAGSPISSKEDLLTAIWKLAAWESETREALDKNYGYTDDDLEAPGRKFGFESSEALLDNAMKAKWYKQRMSLTKTIETCINDWCSGLEIEPSDILRSYEKGEFPKIVSVMDLIENGETKQAYNTACFDPKEEWTALPMDIAYAARPTSIIEGCEEDLQSSIAENETYTLNKAIRNAENFKERYGVEPKNLETARTKRDRLEYSKKPEVPKVGMSTSEARSTKLGPPTRTTRDSGMWAQATHYFGDMYWEQGSKMIFKAHYSDGKIDSVSDLRNTKASPNPWRRSSSSAKSSSSFDPDDHDIEAYYEDNRDEYDDYDDAYDGFLDDENEWDDY